MKHVFRFIGIVVVILVLAAVVLYYLNEHGFLKGTLSEWITNMKNHVTGAYKDTKDVIDEFRGTPDATAQPETTAAP